MELPSINEINIYDSLDERIACEHFYNKTVEQAELLFRENSSYYQEDLMWMGMIAFNFYLQSVDNYINSDFSKDDAHFIDCIYEIINFKKNEKGFQIAQNKLIEITKFVISNFDKFNVNFEIYGDLLLKYKILQMELKNQIFK